MACLLNCELGNVSNMVLSCVVLHNICERAGDNCCQEWIVEEEGIHSSFHTPSHSSTTQHTAVSIRDAIKEHLSR